MKIGFWVLTVGSSLMRQGVARVRKPVNFFEIVFRKSGLMQVSQRNHGRVIFSLPENGFHEIIFLWCYRRKGRDSDAAAGAQAGTAKRRQG
ncbi:hypothetical protein [Paracoccus marcusii]|uniref:hypothetical protein n=1 Tax=Paracoccus marcusii TaxID=59779 RepID=UPI0035A5AA46